MGIEYEKDLYSQIEGLRGQMEGQYNEIKALKTTLDFYAHSGNYRTSHTVCMSQFDAPEPSVIAKDGGRLARIAVAEKRNG